MKFWRANMDLQYVIDAYACVLYITSYMLKDEKNMSELLTQAAEDSADLGVREQLRKVGSCFLTNREVSAQEAVYHLLSLPLRQSTCHVVFINSGSPQTRVAMLRPPAELLDRDDDDQDVLQHNLIDRYAARPQQLDSLCLADFAATYTYCSSSAKGQSIKLVDADGKFIGHMKKRKRIYSTFD